MDEKSTEIGEIKDENMKVKRKIRLCCYFVWPLSFYLSGLGGPTRSIKTPVSIAIRVIEVRNPPTPPRKGDSTRGVTKMDSQRWDIQ